MNTKRVEPIDEYIGNVDLKCVERIKDDYYKLDDLLYILNIDFKDVIKVICDKDIYYYKNEGYIKGETLRLIIFIFGNEEYDNYRNDVVKRDHEYHVKGYVIDDDIVDNFIIPDIEYDYSDFNKQMIEDPDIDEILPSPTDDDMHNIQKYIFEN